MSSIGDASGVKKVMETLEQLAVKIFADAADLSEILAFYQKPYVQGFTTNPSLLARAGVRDYGNFARELLALVPDRPISFEVISDDLERMEQEARLIASWGKNVFVKIPVTNTRGQSTAEVVRHLTLDGIAVNITAIMHPSQIEPLLSCLCFDTPCIISVFAGRIADTGVDPVPLVADTVSLVKDLPKTEVLWASSRELFNIFQAGQAGCHVIMLPPSILQKLHLIGYDLAQFSLDTVKMFYEDAKRAGLVVSPPCYNEIP